MKWQHKCSLEWLSARQQYLTATDVIDLLPFTKTGRKRAVTDEHYLKVWARKMQLLTDDDCISTGAAARGHIMEPFAVDLFNKSGIKGTPYFHWDDIIIVSDDRRMLGFSPDAANMPIPSDGEGAVEYHPFEDMTSILEIKSYSPERHLQCGMTYSMELEERWQLAVAMAVSSHIEDAQLLFFNPAMRDPRSKMFCKFYTRDDLEDEIITVLEIEDKFRNWLNQFGFNNTCITGITERDIIDLICEEQKLNPADSKSIVE